MLTDGYYFSADFSAGSISATVQCYSTVLQYWVLYWVLCWALYWPLGIVLGTVLGTVPICTQHTCAPQAKILAIYSAPQAPQAVLVHPQESPPGGVSVLVGPPLKLTLNTQASKQAKCIAPPTKLLVHPYPARTPLQILLVHPSKSCSYTPPRSPVGHISHAVGDN